MWRWLDIDWGGFGRTKHWLRGQRLISWTIDREVALMHRQLNAEFFQHPTIFEQMVKRSPPMNFKKYSTTVAISGDLAHEMGFDNE